MNSLSAWDKDRLANTAQDLIQLNAKCYCDLGPGMGFMPTLIKQAGREVIAVEAPWEFEIRAQWGKESGIKVYKGEFFQDNFTDEITEPVDCFSLVHCIAHFRFPPHILLEKVWNKLPTGGYFYLSTVNASRLEKVSAILKGQPITEEVKKHSDNPMFEIYKSFNDGTSDYMIWDDWMHVKEYTPGELKKIFEAERFKVIKLQYRNNLKLWKRDLICSVFPQFKDEIIIVGQKI
ncbi:MAG: methyltransferase domain-containing protein [Bacteroidia bacterium]|nr:methyltransferase domain-containing protein [Bacteroidia bacterium]